mmetsp:Transcript_5533/g.5479  ORF Transcript_5533/g.5479 Transcript_5533/m.5479 type:complete len:161 (+) Transcript_5533:44-526(+)
MRNFILSLFFCFFPSTLASLGVDISVATSKESFACLLNQGYTYVIIRAYCSYGAVDPNLVTNIQNAQSAGFQDIGVYMFPCFPCGNPQNQVLQLIDVITPYLEQVRDPIWIEVTKYAWSTNQQKNQNFIFSLGSSIRSLATSTAGILTSQTDWTNIIGSN